MRLADLGCTIAMLALGIASANLATAADQPAYGKVDTFEPGKKYNCVPTADRKGWDCKQIGKAESSESAPPPRQAESAPAPAASAPSKISTLPPSSMPPAPSGRSSELPSYLSAAAASGGPPPQAPVIAPTPAGPPVTAAASKSQISTNPQASNVDARPASAPAETAAPPAVAAEPARAPPPAPEPHVVTPTPSPAPPPVAKQESASPPAPIRATAATPAEQRSHGDGGFLTLPGDQFVIELARGAREADIASSRASVRVPHGEVYELHLRQNGSDVWLLVWGSFDDIGAARAARGELTANASVTPGWPRRIGPLQAEARQVQE